MMASAPVTHVASNKYIVLYKRTCVIQDNNGNQ